MAWYIKRSSRADHKYINKEYKNGRWVYYYNDGESNIAPTLSDTVSDAASSAASYMIINGTKNFMDNAIGEAKRRRRVDEYIKLGKKSVNNYRRKKYNKSSFDERNKRRSRHR